MREKKIARTTIVGGAMKDRLRDSTGYGELSILQ